MRGTESEGTAAETPDAASQGAGEASTGPGAASDERSAASEERGEAFGGRTAIAQVSSDMRVAVFRLSRRLRAQKADDELSDGQLSALSVIHRHGPLTLSELSDHERVKPPSAIRVVNALVDAGCIERSGSAEDGRKVLLTATAHGADIVTDTRRRRDVWLARRLKTLTPAERATLAKATSILRSIADS